MDIHFVAVSAHCVITIYVPVAVYEVIHVAVIPLAIYDDILKIKLPCIGEQYEKFFCYILFCKDVMQMWSPLKKRDIFLFCLFMLNYLFMGLYFNYKDFCKNDSQSIGCSSQVLLYGIQLIIFLEFIITLYNSYNYV